MTQFKYNNDNKKDKLFKEIEKCTCKNKRQYTYPFFFEMKQQKVMLITLVPSFQAVYRQLASIRFFRHIFLALCGQNPIIRSGSLVASFLDAFYWTHYHKCYIPKAKGKTIPESERIPNYCFDKYIIREINLLSPKLIVMLGNPLIHKLLGKTVGEKPLYDEYQGVPVIEADFPKFGIEPEFKEIRETLIKYIPWIDTEPVPDSMRSPVAETKETLAVHAIFEKNGLYAFWKSINGQQNSSAKDINIDKLWIEREVIPRRERYDFILSCFTFLEDQINPLLAENPDIERVFINKKSDGRGYVLEEQIKIIASKYKMEKSLSNIIEDISTLRKIRNVIVHDGGRMLPNNRSKHAIMNVDGIALEPSGCIIVKDQYCKRALKIIENFVDLIERFNTKF